MAKKQTYAEQIQSPQWQKKRLEVLNSKGFKCEKCGNEQEQLNVHHKEYKKGKLIWEYENNELMVLCKTCHSAIHNPDIGIKLSVVEALLLAKVKIILDREEGAASLLCSIFDDIINSDYGMRFLEDMQKVAGLGDIEEIFDLVRIRASFHELEYTTSVEIGLLKKQIAELQKPVNLI